MTTSFLQCAYCIHAAKQVFVRVSIKNLFSNYDILDDCDAYFSLSSLLNLLSPWKTHLWVYPSDCFHKGLSEEVRCSLAVGSANPRRK